MKIANLESICKKRVSMKNSDKRIGMKNAKLENRWKKVVESSYGRLIDY